MRLKLTLHPLDKPVVPINYQYPLSAAIYNVLRKAAPEYASFLHDQGYKTSENRLMKMFTFSKLHIPGGRLVKPGNRALRGSHGDWTLYISSIMTDEFVQNFILGLFESARFSIATTEIKTAFEIRQVEAIAPPQFSETMRFKCLSPITASTKREENGKTKIKYYHPTEAEFPQALCNNLVQKYETAHRKPLAEAKLNFFLGEKDRPRSRLIAIKEGSAQQTNIKAWETYFTLSGTPELLRAAWECGLGEHNSQGFGMIDALSDHETSLEG